MNRIVAAKELVKLARELTAVDLRSQLHQPAKADESLGAAYNSLISFKRGFDSMDEIPPELKIYYSQVLKAMDAVSDARQHTNQLREMTKRLAREV